jgi:hypothetical protein
MPRNSPVYPMEEEWDVLIILDACRFDYFERAHPNYLTGKLEKGISPATCTPDWLKRVFTGWYDDCVYVSANPFVCNFPSQLLSKWQLAQTHFQARQHFPNIVEAWHTGWDSKLGTVHPSSVNRVALDAMSGMPGKRCIVHYMQPHYPYLCYDGFKFRKRNENRIAWLTRRSLIKLFGTETGNRVAKFIAPTEEEVVARKVGLDALRRAYELNLQIVLGYVAKLVDFLEGKVVITADHGELLGEEAKCGHPCNAGNIPLLVEIPWLEMRAQRKYSLDELATTQRGETLTERDDAQIQSQLRALGYL